MKLEFDELSGGCAKKICPWCSTPVMKSQKGRPRTFCSDRCRWAFDKYRIRKRKKESVDIVGIIQILQNINASHVIDKAFLTSTILLKELSHNMDINQWQGDIRYYEARNRDFKAWLFEVKHGDI